MSRKQITLPAVKPLGEVDIHGDSGYRRLTGHPADEGVGRGIRGAGLLRCGNAQDGTAFVHLGNTESHADCKHSPRMLLQRWRLRAASRSVTLPLRPGAN